MLHMWANNLSSVTEAQNFFFYQLFDAPGLANQSLISFVCKVFGIFFPLL